MQPEWPLVSVVVPTRNRAALLRRALHSVLAQSYRRLEVVVVDDGSTDGTPNLLAELRDERIRVIRHPTSRGAAVARNAGAAEARGELLAFLDDDDFWLVEKLERQVRVLCDPERRAIWSIAAFIRLESTARYIGGDYARQLDYANGYGPGGPDWSLIATPGWLLRRDTFLELGGFDERMRSFDDWELGLRLWQIAPPTIVDEPLWIQDWVRGGGLAQLERARADDLRIIVAKHGDVWARRTKVMARHWYVIGRAESLYDPAPAGRSALLRALRLRPFWLRPWAALVMSWLGQPASMRVTRGLRSLRGDGA